MIKLFIVALRLFTLTSGCAKEKIKDNTSLVNTGDAGTAITINVSVDKAAYHPGDVVAFMTDQALPASAKFLRKLRDDVGNLGLAAAAYNAGPGRIQKWLARESELPRETRDYVRIITGTKAEDWTERSDALAIRIDLPREAPCEGVGSLSKSKDVAWVPVNLTPSTTTIIRKAEQLAARLAANRARKHFVSLLRKNGAAHGKARNMIAARAKGAKVHVIRVAARERSSG